MSLNPRTILATSAGPASSAALGQILAKGRDVPSGLYPLTTRHDVEHQVGYDGPSTALWAETGRLSQHQTTSITDSRTLTAQSIPARVAAGEQDVPGPSGAPSRIGKYDWAVENRNAGLVMHRPNGVRAPYVRSWLNDESIKAALDYDIRGNMAYHEWNNTLPQVYEQGNGYAISGPAWVAGAGNGEKNVDVF
jgi:hypothetical protein